MVKPLPRSARGSTAALWEGLQPRLRERVNREVQRTAAASCTARSRLKPLPRSARGSTAALWEGLQPRQRERVNREVQRTAGKTCAAGSRRSRLKPLPRAARGSIAALWEGLPAPTCQQDLSTTKRKTPVGDGGLKSQERLGRRRAAPTDVTPSLRPACVRGRRPRPGYPDRSAPRVSVPVYPIASQTRRCCCCWYRRRRRSRSGTPSRR
jgi:hypothetical protein